MGRRQPAASLKPFAADQRSDLPSMSEFPRVLFVTSAAFNHLTGGGVTFSNLFAGWPKDRLATVHNDAVPTTDDVCNRYYVLGRAEIDLVAPLRIARVLRERGNGTAATRHDAMLRPAGSGGLIARIQGDSAPQRVRLSARLERFIAEFRPDLIYTLLGANAFMDLAARIRRRFALPMVVHLMDDWPSINYRRGLFARCERARMQRLLKDNLAAATMRMGIGAAMCEAFSRRYGQPFVPFQNCVDVARWQAVVRSDSTVRNAPPRVLYVGSVFANAQLASLIELCGAVARLNAAGTPLQFDIASPSFLAAPHRAALAIDPAIRLIEPIEDDREFYRALAAADALVLPVNFDPASVAYIRYSMPTKVPAYMASGTPILVYGPRGVAQVDYAAEDGWGLVVSEPSPAALDAGLRRILTDLDLRERLRSRAQTLAAANHDTTRVRRAFQDALKAAAGMRPRTGM
jgi:glycosyltransferase involved in cell wall biosynthesis